MKSIAKRTQKDYSLAFKLALVAQVEMTYKQAQAYYGIKGRSTVLVWLRKYGQLDWSKGASELKGKGFIMSQSPSTKTPEQRIKELKQQLEETQLKADFFEAVVKVMDRDFGVKLSKKAQIRVVKEKTLAKLTVKKAFMKALKSRVTRKALIHHSDRGVQYCSAEYQQLHKQHNVKCSMTDGYDCYQNALAKRVNGILKSEYLLSKPANLAQAKKMVAESIDIYNQYRPHTALKYKMPDEVHRALYAK